MLTSHYTLQLTRVYAIILVNIVYITSNHNTSQQQHNIHKLMHAYSPQCELSFLSQWFVIAYDWFGHSGIN